MNRASWRSAEDAALAQKQRAAGAALHRHLLVLFAERKLSAKDFSIAMYWAHEAGVQGESFQEYGLKPGAPSDGHYQAKIDKVLVPHAPLYFVEAPCAGRMRGSLQQTMQVATNPLHEALSREIQQDRTILEKAAIFIWHRVYYDNPIVQRAQAGGQTLPLPIAIYFDAVRYSTTIAGRPDSILACWAYNLVSCKRHLVFSLRTADYCRYGCRGWCTLYPLLLSIRWSLDALASGARPQRRHDLRLYSDSEQVAGTLAHEGGKLKLLSHIALAERRLGRSVSYSGHAFVGKYSLALSMLQFATAKSPQPLQKHGYARTSFLV